MLNSKQRANLRSFASNLDASIIIGKDGLTDNVLEQIDKVLTAKEIVKISVLDNSGECARNYLEVCSEKLNAEQVCSIGRKFVLYRFSNKKGVKHITF